MSIRTFARRLSILSVERAESASRTDTIRLRTDPAYRRANPETTTRAKSAGLLGQQPLPPSPAEVLSAYGENAARRRWPWLR